MNTLTVFEAKQAVKVKRRKVLFSIFIGVVALHVAAALTFGSIVIFKRIFAREATFVAPPEPQKKLEPRKLQHSVKVQKQQQKSGRPRIQPRLSAAKISEFALPAIKTAPDKIKDPLKNTNLKSFGASGVGQGTMGGHGMGGLGLGTSQVMLFGIKAQTERVAVLIDLSPSMVEDQRGGFDGFDALKREIRDFIMKLNEGSFFNLIAFERSVNIFQENAALASRKNKKDGTEWLEPFMTNRENVEANGIRSDRAYRPKDGTPTLAPIDKMDGLSRLDLAMSSAMEAGADTIFLITDGTYRIRVPITDPKALEEIDKQAKDPKFLKDLSKRVEEYKEFIRKETEMRKKKGLPPKVIELRSHPTLPTTKREVGNDEVFELFKNLTKTLYTDKGKKAPKLYVIGYITAASDEAFLRKLAGKFQGSFRRTKTLVRPIEE